MDTTSEKGAIPKVLRVALKTGLWTLGLIVVLILVVVAINAFDEDLSPEAEQLLNAPPNPWKPEQNLYLALIGFDALPGESPTAVGQARVVAYDKETERILRDPRAWLARERDDKEARLHFLGKGDFCQPQTGSCWTGVGNYKDEIGETLKANQVLYQRYSGLFRFPGFYETAQPSISGRAAYVPNDVRSLFLVNIALRIKTATSTQQRAAALGDLCNDVWTWRLMLTGEGPVISKLIAVARLREDYAYLGDLIADPMVDTEAVNHEIEAILDTLKPDDWKLRGIYGYEFRMWVPFWEATLHGAQSSIPRKEAEARPWWEPYSVRIQNYFMKTGATTNLAARQYMELQKVADSGAEDFLAARGAYLHWSEENFRLGIRYAYNPTGRFLVGWSKDTYNDYALRAYDVAAFVRMVRLGYTIRQQKLRVENVATFIEQHPQLASHPVNGKPFAWDLNKREMAVRPLGPYPNDRRFGIPIWTSAAP